MKSGSRWQTPILVAPVSTSEDVSQKANWRRPSVDPAAIERLCEELDCSELLATTLHNRDVDLERARKLLAPSREHFHDPWALPDMGIAVERLQGALSADEQILIYGDRDVDGVCASAILVEVLTAIDAPVGWYVPDKYDGYGLSVDAIDSLAERSPDLLVTVDCGTTAHEPIRHATERGMDVVVTDHHDPEGGRPPALACVNPRLPDSEYPNPDLAAGAIAFKLAQALVDGDESTGNEDGGSEEDGTEKFRVIDGGDHPPIDATCLPLAAVATLGDYMDLTLENRAIAREGYRRLVETDAAGLTALREHCEVTSIRDLSWSLVPQLNAAQAADSGSLALEVLFCRDGDRRAELLRTLDEYREQRKVDRREQTEHLRSCFAEQYGQCDADELLVMVETDQYVGSSAMHELSDRTGRPVVTYRRTGGGYKGGARSQADVDFLSLFEACEDLLDGRWGHPGAAGFKVDSSNLCEFEDRLRAKLAERYSPVDLAPTYEIDAIVDLERLRPADCRAIEQLRPFGPGNDEPLFLFEAVELSNTERFGAADEHCRLRAGRDDVELVAWDEGTFEYDLPGKFDIVGTLEWRDDRDRIRIHCEALRPS